MSELREEVPGDAGYEVERFAEKSSPVLGKNDRLAKAYAVDMEQHFPNKAPVLGGCDYCGGTGVVLSGNMEMTCPKCDGKTMPSPVLGETVMPLVKLLPDRGGTADTWFKEGAYQQQKQDLAILRAERLKEAEWLEKWYNDPNTDIDDMHAHIASLKGDREGG